MMGLKNIFLLGPFACFQARNVKLQVDTMFENITSKQEK